MSENEIATLDTNLVLTGEDLNFTVAAEDLAAVMKSGDYWPRVQVMSSNNEIVKKGDFPLGHFALIWTADQMHDLGTKFEFLSLAFRTRAMRIPGGGAVPLSYYDRKDPEFAKIVAEANAKPLSGCMYGPEFLVWIPSEKTFALYFFNNPTLRRVGPDLMNLMVKGEQPDTKAKIYGPTAATSNIRFIKTQKFSWHGADIVPHHDPLPAPEDLPKFQAEVQEVVKKFKNPPANKVEKVEEGTTSGRER